MTMENHGKSWLGKCKVVHVFTPIHLLIFSHSFNRCLCLSVSLAHLIYYTSIIEYDSVIHFMRVIMSFMCNESRVTPNCIELYHVTMFHLGQ